MAQETLHCTLITPEGLAFEGDVDFVAFPARDGEIGILPGRAALMCELGVGRLRVRIGHNFQSWFVDGGFVQVLENHVRILTQQAIPREKIERSEVLRMLTEARQMPVTDEFSAQRKARAEARALIRLRMAR
ncbi:MAG: ATP synthase F1 subunit epsilon [Phycisphaerales bacterium]|nr:ATP synthase F1 subunit epsilon [Phycisphaerales bacterium]